MTPDEPTTLTPDMATEEDPSEAPRLALMRLEVTLDDGRVLTVQVLNPDLVRFDRTAAKHGWPKGVEAPFLAQTFLAWTALRREGRIAKDMTYEAFEGTHALQVRDVPHTNGTGPTAVSPFPAEVGQG